jgi:hypothetical protein
VSILTPVVPRPSTNNEIGLSVQIGCGSIPRTQNFYFASMLDITQNIEDQTFKVLIGVR